MVQTDSFLNELDKDIDILQKQKRFFMQDKPDNTYMWLISNQIQRLEQEKAYILGRRPAGRKARLN